MPSKRRPVEDDESEEEALQTQRRRRALVSDDSEDEEADENGTLIMDADVVDGEEQIVKRFVRYALACEFQRMPIRRAGVLEKVFLKRRINFKRVFEAAQTKLRSTFGMQMVELPVRDKHTTKEKRAAMKSKGGPKSSSSWILITILPTEYRNPRIMPPSIIGSTAEEAEYVGIYSMIIAIIHMSPNHTIPNAKLESILARLNLSKNMGSLDSTLNMIAKLSRQGYIYKSVEKTQDEEQIDWYVGPRGKIEIGNHGVIGLVREVYGEDAPDDLQKRLQKSLGIELGRIPREEDDGEVENGDPGPSTQKRRKARRAVDDD